MPYLRFSRDKRGYESTYVLHTFHGKRGPEPRLLYWFRTPPEARVGRQPLDEEVMRALEASNPDLDFDWEEMRKVRMPPRLPENRRGRPRAARKAPAETPPPARDAARDEPAPQAAEAAEAEETALPPDAPPAADERPPDEPWEHPVVALMGDEMLERLRARYAELQAAIAAGDADPAARDAAQARAAALNPDGWETMEDAVRGIERFEAEAAAVRALLAARGSSPTAFDRPCIPPDGVVRR